MHEPVDDDGVLATRGVELRHLRALVALADELHYGRAAIRLHLAQSTLSRTIADLEGLVGTPLVDRAHRCVTLTDSGRVLVGVAERALTTVDQGVGAARTAPLTLGILGTYGFRWIPALCERLGADAPAIRRVAPEEGLAALTRDACLVVAPLPLVAPPHLASLTLARTDCWIALPRKHHLTASESVPFARIARERLLLPAADASWRAHVELLFRAHGLSVRHGPPASSMPEVLAYVAAGTGWSLAPTREEFHRWEGVELRRITELDRTTIALVWDPDRLTQGAQRVIDTLRAIATETDEPLLSVV